MSSDVTVSPKNSINKTRNAILRMKNCSPKLRTILRQRCQERIHNERGKILDAFRKRSIQDSFKAAFGSIIREEWENIESVESCELLTEKQLTQATPDLEFNLDEELLLEELLEKELLMEHEDWLFQQYEELLNEELHDSNDVVCPLCCSGFLESTNFFDSNRIECRKCLETFTIDKSLLDLQSSIYECLTWHDKQCDGNPSFVNVLKNEKENNLCIICDQCSFLNIIA